MKECWNLAPQEASTARTECGRHRPTMAMQPALARARVRNADDKKDKAPSSFDAERGFGLGPWRRPTLTWPTATLPSALSVFTSEFGMGSGGSRSQ